MSRGSAGASARTPTPEWVDRVEQELRPRLEKAAVELGKRFRRVAATVESQSRGTTSKPTRHSLALDCILHDFDMEPIEQVALTIELRELRKQGVLDVEVCWASGDVETRLSGSPRALDEEAFGDLVSELDELVAGLASAIARGGPV